MYKTVKCRAELKRGMKILAAERGQEMQVLVDEALEAYLKQMRSEVVPEAQASGSIGVGEKRAVGHGR